MKEYNKNIVICIKKKYRSLLKSNKIYCPNKPKTNT